MGEIVNLNRARKRVARVQAAAQAKRNRVRFGRTGVEREGDRRDEAARAALLDGKRRTSDEAPPTEA